MWSALSHKPTKIERHSLSLGAQIYPTISIICSIYNTLPPTKLQFISFVQKSCFTHLAFSPSSFISARCAVCSTLLCSHCAVVNFAFSDMFFSLSLYWCERIRAFFSLSLISFVSLLCRLCMAWHFFPFCCVFLKGSLDALSLNFFTLHSKCSPLFLFLCVYVHVWRAVFSTSFHFSTT